MTTTKRRPKGEGSITKLSNGKIRIRVETTPIEGKRQWLSATANTKKEAVEKLKALQRQQKDNHLHLIASIDTIEYQIEPFIRHLKAIGRQGATLRVYRMVLSELLSSTNNIKLSKITSTNIDNLILQWKDNGAKETTLSTKTNRLKVFFEWCVETDLLSKNPLATYHSHSRQKKTKANLLVLSVEEHNRIKDYLYGFWIRKTKPIKRWSLKFRMYALYCLAYETGMRDGEIAALTWDNISLADNTVTVMSTVKTDEDSSKFIGKPKTKQGYRTIKISQKTTDLLADLFEFSGSISPFVFYNHKTNNHYWGEAICGSFKLVLSAVGIKRHFTFHDIRHTNASNMIYKNVPIAVITERLGHSDISVTYATYGHIIQECKEANEAVIEA